MEATALVLLAFLGAAVVSLCVATPEGQALIAIEGALGVSLNWSGLDPCAGTGWSGVSCSPDGHVLGLNMSNMGLKGTLPPELGELSYLEFLDLSNNRISGTIPSFFANLTYLANLKLDHTSISGAIPPGIGNLTKLQYLYLGNNSNLQGPLPSSELGLLTELLELTIWGANLNTTLPHELGNCSKLQYINFHASVMSGSLPEEYGSLQNLKKLLLHNNNLEGVIPQTWRNLMPHLTDLELQNNDLYGDLPDFILQQASGVTSIACNYFKGPTPSHNNSVLYSNGNCFQENVNSHSIYCVTATCNRFYELINLSLPTESHSNTGVLVGAILGSAASVVFVALALFGSYKWWKKRNSVPDYFNERNHNSTGAKDTDHWEVPKSIRRFTIQELAKATGGFDKLYHIGSGGFGQVYSGCLEDGTLIAIKRASPSSLQGHTEFRNELSLLSRLHHRHLVRLEGFCDDNGQQILVYEFMKNGNLNTHLAGEVPSKALNWYKRIEVALGVAQGLEYLHCFADPPVIHRDVKPSNILLDENMVAKLADFGISKVGSTFDTHISTRPAGTAGFLDPDYFITRQLTPASDVYGFGVVLLEMITGRKVIDHLRDDETNLLVWVKHKLAEGGIDLIRDPKLQPEFPPDVFTTLTDLALNCTMYERLERPTMKVVVNVLETMLKDVKVPPYEQPPLSQTYSTASTSESGTHSSSITETQQNPFSYKSNNMGNIFDALNEGQVTLPLTSSSIFSNSSR
ncbi:unnamed protein product [Sphagnum compactum]